MPLPLPRGRQSEQMAHHESPRCLHELRWSYAQPSASTPWSSLPHVNQYDATTAEGAQGRISTLDDIRAELQRMVPEEAEA